MEKIEFYEQDLYSKNEQDKLEIVGKMAILKGGIGSVNPKAVMDEAVEKYVGYNNYCQFVEIHLDNPWVRVVIKGINALKYVPFTKQQI